MAVAVAVMNEVFHGEPSAPSIEDQAHRWLLDWRAATRGGVEVLGYPRRWVTDKANEGGIAAGSPRPPTVLPPEEAKTDRAVARLGDRYRSVLRWVIKLHYQEGLPVEGVANALRCNTGKARATIKRAQRAVFRIRYTL